MLKKIGSVRSLLGIGLLAAALVGCATPSRALDLLLDGRFVGACGTATATGNGTAGAATLSNKCGTITTEALTAPTASEYTLTLTNTVVTGSDIILFSVANGTNSAGLAGAMRTTPGSGSATLVVRQMSAASFNGTLKINYFVIKATN